MMKVLTNLILVIVSQYRCVSYHNIVYLKLLHNVICQFYLNTTGKKRISNFKCMDALLACMHRYVDQSDLLNDS